MHLNIAILVILHQEEVSGQPEAEPNLVPIAYFSGTWGKTHILDHWALELHSSLTSSSNTFWAKRM